MIDDNPALAEPDGTSDRHVIAVVDAAHAQRVIGLVLRTVWDSVIEGAKAVLPVSPRLR